MLRYNDFAKLRMNAPITHVSSKVIIERKRLLPGPAKILVRKGQIVKAVDPVVEGIINPAHILLDAARGLGVSIERADELISCKPGAIVSRGDLLAGPVGLTRRVVRAPEAGKIALIDQSKILLELTERAQQLRAGYQGEIVDLIAERGVVIHCDGALIQGIWGNGEIGQGLLKPLIDHPDQLIKPDMINETYAGSVLVGGYCDDPLVFVDAEEISIQGIVLASLHPDLLDQAVKLEIPVLLVEGFGRHPMNKVVLDMITSLSGQFVTINAERPNILTGTLPEMIVPGLGSSEKLKPVIIDLFAPGKVVRQVGSLDLGRAGELVDFIDDIALPNGTRVEAARIRFEEEVFADVPLANLEILG